MGAAAEKAAAGPPTAKVDEPRVEPKLPQHHRHLGRADPLWRGLHAAAELLPAGRVEARVPGRLEPRLERGCTVADDGKCSQ